MARQIQVRILSWSMLFVVNWLTGAAFAQSPTASLPAKETSSQEVSLQTPTETVLAFYRLLREQRLTDAFRLHVCNPAVEKLTAQQLAELEPEFLRLIGGIPEKLVISGETISGDSATVFVVMPDKVTPGGRPQMVTAPVGLIRIDGRWLIGDRETRELALAHGNNFFKLSEEGVFIRMAQNEDAMARLLRQLLEIEQVFARNNRGNYATLSELVKHRSQFREDIAQVIALLESGEIFGHTIEIVVSPDRRDFAIYAVPKRYNYDGRYSFYADRSGVRYCNHGGARIEKNTPGSKLLN